MSHAQQSKTKLLRSSVSLSHPCQNIMSIPILNQIEQSEAKLRKLQTSLDEEQASVSKAAKKYEANQRRGKVTKELVSEGAYKPSAWRPSKSATRTSSLAEAPRAPRASHSSPT